MWCLSETCSVMTLLRPFTTLLIKAVLVGPYLSLVMESHGKNQVHRELTQAVSFHWLRSSWLCTLVSTCRNRHTLASYWCFEHVVRFRKMKVSFSVTACDAIRIWNAFGCSTMADCQATILSHIERVQILIPELIGVMCLLTLLNQRGLPWIYAQPQSRPNLIPVRSTNLHQSTFQRIGKEWPRLNIFDLRL